jgi:hypothetical protein
VAKLVDIRDLKSEIYNSEFILTLVCSARWLKC